MEIFFTAFGQMLVLFALILAGYILVKSGAVPDNTHSALSKLENYALLPAMAFGTFSKNCTGENIASLGGLLVGSAIVFAVVLPLSLVCSRLLSRDEYIRKIYTYGLCFSNFGFMGFAVVQSLFPELFFEYNIFVLILWVAIYTWGVPYLLMPGGSGTFKETLKRILNPMLIAMALGIAVGLSGIRLPVFVTSVTESLTACMSPLAMMLTGMTVAHFELKKILKLKSVYIITFIRLIVFPFVFLLAVFLLDKLTGIKLGHTLALCALCSVSMPLGLNTVVIPSAYGSDTSVASGMAIVSHAFSLITIPLVFCVASFVI